jgi:hypothetical protein
VLEAADIKVVTGCGGTARDLVEQIRQVGLAKVGSPSDESAGQADDSEDSVEEPARIVGRAPRPMGLAVGRRQRDEQTGGGGRRSGGRGRRRGFGGRGRGRRLGWP